MERGQRPAAGSNLDKLLDIRTRHERPAAADDYDRAHVRVRLQGPEGGVDSFEHPGTKCVYRRMIDGNHADALVNRKSD